jgi:hypothetical protein
LKTALNILFIFLLHTQVYGQGAFWLELRAIRESSCTEDYQLSQEERTMMIDSLHRLGVSVRFSSTWFPAVSVQTSSKEQTECIKQLEFVHQLLAVQSFLPAQNEAASPYQLSFALEQIKGHVLIEQRLKGKGVKVGIIDGGFLDAHINSSLKAIYEEGMVRFFKDFITPQRINFYEGFRVSNDQHGTQVWKMLAGYHPVENRHYGLATDADFYLMRTDHGKRETRIEEDYLVAALELMDSLAVRLVNISLGYARGFDDKSENHEPWEVDGKSSMLTRATNKAAQEKGMLLVFSAGNEGNDKTWQVLSLPADAEHALAVGATRYSEWAKTNYSSIGPESLCFVKPDISCFASGGTSYAAPVITGLAAAIWQYDSTLTNFQLMDIIRKSGHLYRSPNNFIGYGVPDAARILNYLQSKHDSLLINPIQIIRASANQLSLPVPDPWLEQSDWRPVVFHKKDSINVLSQEILPPAQATYLVQQQPGATASTLSFHEYVYEIFWPEDEP